ncbi:MAG: TIGR03862 family flavoprotein [Pseudomonadota bacterium]
MAEALVVGAGPAGLMAAEMLAEGGAQVTIAEAMPSPGRKFLMAGRSGLNLTKDEPAARFAEAYREAEGPLGPMLAGFEPEAVQAWARALGQPVFTGSTGRVFPEAMKASPLLRAWLARLAERGVALERRWRWTGWERGGGSLGWRFETSEGPRCLRPDVGVLALGGASWARLGSDGAWSAILRDAGIALAPFRPANMGIRVAWSAPIAAQFGQPVKNIGLAAGARRIRGECVISARGLEGSGIYALYRELREGAPLTLDLLPDLAADRVAERLSRPRGKASLASVLRKGLKIDPARRALLMEFARPLPAEPEALAARLKALAVRHDGPRPMDEAISTAGGVAWEALDEALMLRALPGVFCAGEMLDWEAPTGGYLITGCLATGRWAGLSARRWVAARP